MLALAGSAAAYSLKVLGLGPGEAILIGLAVGLAAGAFNGVMTVAFGLPAFIATLGMFYIARGVASWIVAGQQLTGLTEGYNLHRPQGRRHPRLFRSAAARPAFSARSPTWSACRRSG